MMSLRSPDFQQFLTLAEAAVRHGPGVKGPVCAAAERIFTALRAPSAQAGPPRAVRLPVCRHLETALDHVRGQPRPVSALADAFAVIEPQPPWKARAGAETQGERFL